jgi:hypothetical protein
MNMMAGGSLHTYFATKAVSQHGATSFEISGDTLEAGQHHIMRL